MRAKISDILINSLFYALYFVCSCIVVMFAEIITVKVLNLFVVVDNLSLCIIRIAVYFIGVNATLAAVSYREGYKTPSRSVSVHAISATVAVVWHLLPSMLFNFAAICSGEVRFIAILAKFGSKIKSPSFSGTISAIDCIPYFFIVGAIHVAVMAAAGYIGARARLRDRVELTRDSDDNNSSI